MFIVYYRDSKRAAIEAVLLTSPMMYIPLDILFYLSRHFNMNDIAMSIL